MSVSSGIAPAAGADIYYERRGAGPPLLLIVGGGGDCAYYDGLADVLARDYTVLSYDRRGNSRSVLHARPAPLRLPEQNQDALAVLRSAGFASALIFGNSGGATIALDLAAHCPDAAEFVIAHEPPVPLVLPDARQYLSIYDDIDAALHADGWVAAFTMFQERIGRLAPNIIAALLDPARRMPAGPQRDLMMRVSANWEFLATYEVDSFIHYEPDLAAIIGNGRRIALGYGALTADPAAVQMSTVTADRLGVPCVEFPGGHTGPLERPGEFAQVLRATLVERG